MANGEIMLVTGGAGFIGGHLVDALLARGFGVRVLDCLLHGGKKPTWLPSEVEFIKGDVRNKKDWEKSLPGVTGVFHLAGYMDFNPDYSTYIGTNALSVALLYEVIRENNFPVKKVITASSQGVYGEGKYVCPQHGYFFALPRRQEDLAAGRWEVRCPSCGAECTNGFLREDDEINPVNLYGISKMSLENILFFLASETGIPAVALRYSIVHGSRQTFLHFYSGVLRHFAVSALAGLPFQIHEDGQQKRDFVHVGDVVDAHFVVWESDKADNNVFNVGSGREEAVKNLAETVAEVSGVKFEADPNTKYRIGTARHSVSDIARLSTLGWQVQKSLVDNVRDYLEWVREFPEAKEYLCKTIASKAFSDRVKTAKNI